MPLQQFCYLRSPLLHSILCSLLSSHISKDCWIPDPEVRFKRGVKISSEIPHSPPEMFPQYKMRSPLGSIETSTAPNPSHLQPMIFISRNLLFYLCSMRTITECLQLNRQTAQKSSYTEVPALIATAALLCCKLNLTSSQAEPRGRTELLNWWITDDVGGMGVSGYLCTLTSAGLVGVESSRNICSNMNDERWCHLLKKSFDATGFIVG